MAKKKASGKKSADKSGSAVPKKKRAKRASAKAPRKTRKKLAPGGKHAVEQYDHKNEQRTNNPPVGLVTPETDSTETAKKTYAYDPHLDPQLTWAGKAEQLSLAVPTVSLHVHERIDPRTILRAVRSNSKHPPAPGLGDPPTKGKGPVRQLGLFEDPEEQLPRREAIEFYKHARGWTNRLIAGDSLLVMNSLLEKEGMSGKVQMVYLDPPYGIRYRSNFQPFTGKRDLPAVDRDVDLTTEPEMLRAFRDTWELGLHSFLTYLRDRVLLCRELLTTSGSLFFQISDENVHLVRNILDEVFGARNFVVGIFYRKKGSQRGNRIQPINDHILWYAKDKDQLQHFPVYTSKMEADDLSEEFDYVEYADGTVQPISGLSAGDIQTAISDGGRLYIPEPLTSGGEYRTQLYDVEHQGRTFTPPSNNCWKFNEDGMNRIKESGRLHVGKKQIRFKKYHTDFPFTRLSNLWDDLAGARDKVYVVQTAGKAVERCMQLTTEPGQLVLDPTCGSGTTAVAAEKLGRRWVTCDTSRVALTLAKQRLTALCCDYYQLRDESRGVSGGFVYDEVPHVTSTTVANELKPAPEPIRSAPSIDGSKTRITGPFTVEAVPAVQVRPLDEVEPASTDDNSVSRSGVTVRQEDWRSELLKTGIRGRGGQLLEFAWLEPLPANRFLHALGETRGNKPKRVVASFGPEHAPIEQRHVDQALDEAEKLRPKADLVLFAAFHFDPEAAKDIDETQWPGVEVQKVQMNADLLTNDLKKKRASNESFWLVGQPDVEIEQITEGDDQGRWQVRVRGFDYYNPAKGTIESGGTEKIALWMLDTDYDGRSLYPRQVFFCLSPGSDQLKRLAKTLKAEIDPDRIESYFGVESLPFDAGEFGRVAVKIVDDRGIESLRIVDLPSSS